MNYAACSAVGASILKTTIPTLVITNVNKPKVAVNKETLSPPAKTAGSALPIASKESKADINQVMRNSIWTEDGKTTSGKAYNFRNLSVCHANNNDPVSAITDLASYENQRRFRNEMQQCIESIVTTSPEEFIKLTKRLR